MSDNSTSQSKQKGRTLRTVTGGLVLLIGIIAIPYPGPGWLIVFAGLAILAKDYPWAERVLLIGRKKYDDWNEWIKKQNWFIKSLTLLGTIVVVVATIWLINGYGLISSWPHLNLDWLNSPLPLFR